MKNISILISLIFVLVNSILYSKEKGKLIIIGGVQTTPIIEKFVDLAGGKDARILIIPNAGSEPKLNSKIEQKEFNRLGAKSDYILFNFETADNPENLNKMNWANAVFFTGGDQSNLTRDMSGTKLLEKVFELYNNGGVIGGTSAGAAVMSELMITGNELINKDSTRSFISIEKGNIEIKPGFGFIKNVIIDQHFLKRKRHNRTISTLIEHPNYLGIAIDESTSIIVYPDDIFEVFGKYQVLIYDPTDSKDIREDKAGNLGITNMKMHVLINGDKFDLKSKKVVELTNLK